LLTDRYLNGVPSDSRAGKSVGFLKKEHITEEKLQKIRSLNEIAVRRGQSLAQMALAWILRDQRVTSVLIGASKPEQLTDSLKSLERIAFEQSELSAIEAILS
jgi:L-glyceraldehyde 3-phosphate reductase